MISVDMMWVVRAVGVTYLLLLCITSHGSSAFSVSMPHNTQLSFNSLPLDSIAADSRDYFLPDLDDYKFTEDTEQDHVDSLLDVYKRYTRGWGHRSRFPWKRLPDRMCYRQQCHRHKDCCRRYNLCDMSAKVCVDCWYGSKCRSEADCCERFKFCARTWRRDPKKGYRYVAEGKCVNKL